MFNKLKFFVGSHAELTDWLMDEIILWMKTA